MKRPAAHAAHVKTILSCLVCDRPLGSFRLAQSSGVILKCVRCGTVQHRHLEVYAPLPLS